jgi:hypothetical protein
MGMPIVKGILLCDSVSIDPALGKSSLLGVFDQVHAIQYPPTLRGSVFVVLSEVNEAVQLRIEAVSYEDNPLASKRSVFGTISVPALNGSTASVYISGNLTFPVSKAGMADIFVYANDEFIGHRSISIVDMPTQPGAT